MASPDPVWLGTPLAEGDADTADAYVTKIGGKAVLLRAAGADATAGCPPPAFHCPKCRSTQRVSLLAQLYAPLGCDDRVLYVLTCAACGVLPGPRTEGQALATAPPMARTAHPPPKRAVGAATVTRTSFCFAVRCENFNRQYYDELHAAQARAAAEAVTHAQAAAVRQAAEAAVIFSEGADWGSEGADDWGSETNGDEEDADGEGGGSPSSGAPGPAQVDSVGDGTLTAAPTAPLPALREAFPLAAAGTLVPLKGRTYTSGIPLDLFAEPPRPVERLGSTEEQLLEAQRRYGVEAGSLDSLSYEEDDESPAEKVVRKYVERIEQAPSQCVRWCPGGEPLRAALMPPLQPVPPCPACRAPRRFECQLTAPLVYYLTKDIGESKNTDLHFANVFVYTCSENCCSATAYVPEHVIVEDEI